MQPALQGFWVPCTPARLRRFHLRVRPLPTAVHRFFRNRNILPRASRPLQSARVPHPPRTRSPEQLPWGLAPLRDINQQRPHSCGIPGPHCVPSSASLTPSTVCSATGLAGLFHPAAASRVRPSGVCSSNAAARTRRPPIPSCRCACPPADPVTRDRASEPAPGFRALLSARVSCLDNGVTRCRTEAPLGLFLPRVFLPLAVELGLPNSSVRDLHAKLLRSPRGTFDVLPTSSFHPSLSRGTDPSEVCGLPRV
jgi:hypothetical protein